MTPKKRDPVRKRMRLDAFENGKASRERLKPETFLLTKFFKSSERDEGLLSV